MSPSTQILQRIFVALTVGLLIGLERERAEDRKGVKVFAGVRTFPLIALIGAGLAVLSPEIGPLGVVAGFATIAAVALVGYHRNASKGEIGATTEMAALGTFILGALAGFGQLVVAGAIGVGVTVLLAAKPHLETFSRALTEKELVAVLQLAAISAVVLPLLPDRGYGPWLALNPFQIWLPVVLISAVSFGGFIAVRVWGDRRGIWIGSLVGALASSTAVTVAMAERSRRNPAAGSLVATGATLASMVMCGRVAVLVALTRPAVLLALLPMLVVMVAVGGIASARLWRSGPAGDDAPRTPAPVSEPLTNPFRLRSALLFGLIFAVTLLMVRAAQAFLATPGLFAAAALAGLVDVDAITMALARESSTVSPVAHVAAAIGLAVVSNMLVKLAIVLWTGQGSFRHQAALALAGMAVAGTVTIIYTTAGSSALITTMARLLHR